MDEKRTAWERLQLVHTKGRPTIKDYIPQIFTAFYEMHGDRLCGDDPALIGAPEGFRVTVRNLKVSAGAGFIVALTGDILTMPGLPKVPAAERIDIDRDGVITGLF